MVTSKPISERTRVAAGRAVRERADSWAIAIRPAISAVQESGVKSMRAIAKELNAQGVLTSRDKNWSGVQVARVLKRL
jgi:recombinase